MEGAVAAGYFYTLAAGIEIGMQRSTGKPGERGGRGVKIDDGGESEGEIGARNLSAIGAPEFGVGVDGVIIERGGVGDMDVGVNEARNEEAAGAVHFAGMRAGGEIEGDFVDAAVANDYIGVGEGSGPFGGDQSDVLDDGGVVDDAWW